MGRIILIFLLLLFAPQLTLTVYYQARIHRQINDIPILEYGVVFGAYVREDGTLSDAALERIEAAVLLYQERKIKKLFVSGTNRSNAEAEVMAQYAQSRGVMMEDIMIDGLGIDTHDTCRHFSEVGKEAILISQGYHLPRTMYMCKRDRVAGVGLAANGLNILLKRGDNLIDIYGTRTQRFVRESVLTWSYILGVYDLMSQEAEGQE